TFPFVQLDAVVLRIRDDDRVRSQSGLLATGVNEDGYREVLGLMIGDSESEASWSPSGWSCAGRSRGGRCTRLPHGMAKLPPGTRSAPSRTWASKLLRGLSGRTPGSTGTIMTSAPHSLVRVVGPQVGV